jgi:hypothetical protein
MLSDDSQVTFTNVPGLLEAIKGLNQLQELLPAPHFR